MNCVNKFFFGVEVVGISEKNFATKSFSTSKQILGVIFRSFSGQNTSSLIVVTGPKKIQKISFIDFIYMSTTNGQWGRSLSFAETSYKVKIIVCRRLNFVIKYITCIETVLD